MKYGVHRLASGKPRGTPVAIGEVLGCCANDGNIVTKDRGLRPVFTRVMHGADAVHARILHNPAVSKQACRFAAHGSQPRLRVIEATRKGGRAEHDGTFHALARLPEFSRAAEAAGRGLARFVSVCR
ncbi:hypothetical protein JCM10599A_20160 [Paraburkholderia kururiensis]